MHIITACGKVVTLQTRCYTRTPGWNLVGDTVANDAPHCILRKPVTSTGLPTPLCTKTSGLAKHCPGNVAANCVDGNTAHPTLSAALAKCALVPECGYVMECGASFYLRRDSDPSAPGACNLYEFIPGCTPEDPLMSPPPPPPPVPPLPLSPPPLVWVTSPVSYLPWESCDTQVSTGPAYIYSSRAAAHSACVAAGCTGLASKLDVASKANVCATGYYP